jgi:hypothetical protein
MPYGESIKPGETHLEMEDRNAYPVRNSTHHTDGDNIAKTLGEMRQ